MRCNSVSRVIRVLTATCVLAALTGYAHAQKVAESSAETRFQLDLHVPDAALASFLPPGWSSSVATQGPAKDANLRAVFIDRLTINGPDGKPVGSTGSNRLAYLVAPVKNPAGESVQLVIGGLTEDPSDAPGPFGVYLPATTHRMRRTVSKWHLAAPCFNRRIGYSRRRAGSGWNCTSNSKRAPGIEPILPM